MSICEWQCVENGTCWVKLSRSRNEMNFKTLESVRSSTWMLKSQVIKSSYGVVDIDEMSVWKSSINWTKEAASRDLAGEDGGW